MKRSTIAAAVLLTCSAFAQGPGFQDPLLDKLAGQWLMTGTIAGGQVNHDLDIQWVLAHNYLRIHEVARETDSLGMPAYEAIVFIGWDAPSARYVCLWLDVTGGGGLTGDGLGYASRVGDSIPFVFDDGTGSVIHNTFAYDDAGDMWRWAIDNDRDGIRTPFARVRLDRKR